MAAAEPCVADDLAVMAAMELLDAGWNWATIAQALRRDEAWVRREVEAAACDEAASAALH